MNHLGYNTYTYIWKRHKGTPCITILNTKIVFLLTKSENRRVKQVLSQGAGTSEGGFENVDKGCGRMNMVQILYTHVCKWKIETC
jgi:hypothetical protein